MSESKIKSIIFASITAVVVVAEVTSCICKKMKAKKATKETTEAQGTSVDNTITEDVEVVDDNNSDIKVNNDVEEVETEVEDVEDAEDVDGETAEICGVIMDEAETTSVIDIYKQFLIDNGVDTNEVDSVIETFTLIDSEMPEKMPEICEEMNECMSGEFDIKKCHILDKAAFMSLYHSIDPKDLLLKHKSKLIRFSGEKFNKLLTIANKIKKQKTSTAVEYAEIIYDFYHRVNSAVDCGDYTEEKFQEIFGDLITKYVKETPKKETQPKIVEDYREVKVD